MKSEKSIQLNVKQPTKEIRNYDSKRLNLYSRDNLKKNILLSFSLVLSLYCFSQKIYENKFYSEYKYIIKLDSSQLRFLLQKNKLDTAWIFNTIVDSFYKDSNYNYLKLGFGTYIICYVNEHQVFLNTYHKQPFSMDVWGVNTKNYIIVKDDQGKVIEDAKVSLLNNKICPYSIGMASYELPKIPNGTIIKIEYRDNFDYMLVNPSYYNPPPYNKTYPDYSHNTILPGYIALNQPKYKQNDTLKFKAFLVYADGSYYYQKICLWMRNDYDGKEKLIGNYKYKTPGAYFGEFVLGDTLVADRGYTLILRNGLNEELKRTNFYIENYELKKNTYELSMASTVIYPGQKIIVITKARDANNLPVMDGYVKFNVRLSNVNQVNTNKFFVPNSWYQSLFAFEKELDPSGYTTLEIPDSIFINFDCNISVDATFTNEDNELITRSTYFLYHNKNQTYTINYQRDSVKADYFYQSKSGKQELRFVTVYNNYVRVSENITTPYIRKIDYAAVKYELYKNDTLVAEYNCPEIQQVIGMFGKRTADSVFIKLYNPLMIPVHYEIYKNKRKVAEGKSVTVDFKTSDLSTESYYIIWGHNYKGGLRNNYKTQAFHYQEKKLNVDINQPEEIYPGQEVNVSVTVTDAKKKPAANINLTAYSVNTQFGEIPLPDVPYMGLIRNDEPLHFTQPNFQVYNCNANLPLKTYQIAALHLYRNEMYKLVYRTDPKTILNFKISKNNPEYAVYLFKQNRLQPVISIIVDEQIAYHSNNSIPKQYSFQSISGKHSIKIRTNSMLINLGEIMFEDSSKYIIGINLDSVKKLDTTRLLPGMFEKKEYGTYINQTLFIHIDEAFDTMKIYQGNRLCFFGDRSSTYKKIFIDKDYFYAITILEKGDLKIKLNNLYEHEIVFDPDKIYYMNKDEVRSYPRSNKSNLNPVYFDNSANISYNINSFQQVYINADDKILDSTVNTLTIAKEKNQRPRPFIYYRDYAPSPNGKRNSLVIYQKHNYVPYKRAWLINKRNDSLSVIGNFTGFINYADSGLYDLILLNDTAMCISKNLYLPPNGTMHLFLYANEIKELDQDSIWEYERIVKKLTKIPLRLFTDSPITIRPQIMKVIKTNKAYGKLSGNVVDAFYHTPLDLTTIIAEVDGVFKGGALTNADGDFEINFLPPGNYMLKIRVEGYRYQVVYNLALEKGIEKILKIKLLNLEDSVHLDKQGNVVYGEDPSRKKYKKSENIGYGDEMSYDVQNAPAMSYSSGANQTSIERMASKTAGVYTTNSVQEVAISSYNNLNDGIIESPIPIEKINADQMQQRLNDLAQEAGANRVRNIYRDYGYWVPNILTNKAGVANFTVRFPDNITSWKTIVPAMNGNRQSGLSTMVTKSYKPLIAAMATPSYLVAGDKINLKGKIINYTGNFQDVKINFSLNDIAKKDYLAIIDKVATDTFTVNAINAFDTLKTSFSLKMLNGYLDGEERKIPVKPNGILISRSEYLQLIKDTSIQYIIPNDVMKAIVYVHNSEVEQLKREIEELKNYGYGCTEQTTSKLRAMLAEKAIANALKIPFTGDKQIKQLIKRLESLKNNKGTWGWWENAGEDYWLTMYVIKTLNEARLAGYSNNHYIRAANKMEEELPKMNLQTQLEALNLLKDMDRKVPFDTFTKKMDYINLNVNQKLLYIRLMQRLHKSYDINDVVSLSNELPNGALSWGTQVYNYKYDEAANTLLAFDILRKDSVGRNLLPNIKTYFNSNSFTRHTLARAGIISLYLNDWSEHHDKNENMFGEVTVNGNKLNTKDYPFKRTFESNDTINIQHKGKESYVNIITQKIETKPQPDETFFRISSSINQQKNNIILKPGEITTIQVNVEVFMTSENVLLEIPLPAGFSYYSKPQGNNYAETHREYFNDKTSIFCTTLPRGKYTFTIQVVPKYTGTFNLPPAKIELMYYPEIRNNEAPKVVVVQLH